MRRYFWFLIIFVVAFYFVFAKNKKIDNVLTEDYDPVYKINDLYKSDELNYRELLSDKEKEVYGKLINAIINFEEEVVLDISFNKHSTNFSYVDDARRINDAVIMDHPELIHYAYPGIYNNVEGGKVRLKLYYAFNKSDYNKYVKYINNEITKIKNDVSELSTYDKVKYVYEYLGNKNTYGDKNDIKAQSPVSAFVSNFSPVCAGYARASQLIFSNIGINSLLVTGDLKSSWITGDAHEWNIVKIDNMYYNYDVTQSSAFKSYTKKISYMGLFSMDKSSFSLRYKDVSPYIKNNGLDYYTNNDLYYNYKSSNIDKLKAILESTNDKYVEIKMDNITSFKFNFDSIKDEIGVSEYRVIDDIIVFKKVTNYKKSSDFLQKF